MIINPDNSRRGRPGTLLQFVGSVYVAKTNARIDGSHIVGEREHPARLMRGSAALQLLEDFANWPVELEYDPTPTFQVIGSNAREIIRFTKRYGPLDPLFPKRADFRFPVHRWVIRQREFRWHWERLGRKAYPSHWKGQPTLVSEASVSEEYRMPDEIDGRFVRHGEEWLYEAPSLWGFLLLSLYLRPAERLRKCHCPDCRTPYFVARHLRENYCSTPSCVAWGQAKWKREWWKEYGAEWRKGK